MPITTIPLAGNPTRRPYTDHAVHKNQGFFGCYFEEAPSPITGQKPIYVTKRPGIVDFGTAAGGSVGDGAFFSQSLGVIFGAFGSTNSTIYRHTTAAVTTSLGTITGRLAHFNETIISGVAHILMTSNDSTAWYFASDAADSLTYTADGNNSTTITDIKISGVNSVAGLYVGQKLTAASNIVAGSRIVSINASAFSAVLDTATTGGAFNDLSITKEPVAKITDSDFPTDIVGGFASMNGYTYIMDDDGNIYNSDLNSISSWNPANLALANSYPDVGRGVIRHKNLICAFGSDSVEFFAHSSNATFGTPLMRLQEAISGIGLKAASITGVSSPIRMLYEAGHGSIWWIGNDANLYTLDGLSARPVTKSPFTSSQETRAVVAFTVGRKRFVMFTSGMMYDVDTGMFSYINAGNTYYIVGPDLNGFSYAVTSGTTGKFYILYSNTQAVYQDDSVAYSLDIQTDAHYLNNGKGFKINSVRLIADTQSAGTTTLKASGNDYASFSTLGTFDLTSEKKQIFRCGYYKSNVVFALEDTNNQAWRGQALIVDWEPCST